MSYTIAPNDDGRERVSDRADTEAYGVGLFLWEIVKTCALAFVIIIPIRVFFFQPFFVQGSSMEPNFEDGQYLVIGELGYKKTDINVLGGSLFSVEPTKRLHRQEVAVFHPPMVSRGDQFFIKRVIGLPGETVDIRDGRVTIRNDAFPQGFVLDESAYLSDAVPTFVSSGSTSFSIKLKADEYFLMGDNRLYSHDSRAFGPVGKDHIIGLVLLRAWPVSKAQVY
jgi:signal peptidase I